MKKSNFVLVDTATINPINLTNTDILSNSDVLELYKNNDTLFKSDEIYLVRSKTHADVRLINASGIRKTSIHEHIIQSLELMNTFKHIYKIFILSNENFNISEYKNQGYDIELISSLDAIKNEPDDNYEVSEEQIDIRNQLIHISQNMNRSNKDPQALFSKECNMDTYIPIKSEIGIEHMRKYIFIDTENVGPKGFEACEELDTSDIIKIYKSKACEAVVNKILKDKNSIPAEIFTHDVPFTMKNAMDCMIVNDICNLAHYRQLYDFYIITKDSDYSKPVKTLKEKGYNINVFPSIKKMLESKTLDQIESHNTTPYEKTITSCYDICKNLLKDTKFEAHTKWIIKELTEKHPILIKFDIASQFSQKHTEEFIKILDVILKTIEQHHISLPYETQIIDLPSEKDVAKYIENVLKSENLGKNLSCFISRLAKAKTVNDINETICHHIKSNKRKNITKRIIHYKNVIAEYNESTTRQNITSLQKEIVQVKKELPWLNEFQIGTFLNQITELTTEKDIHVLLDTIATSKSEKNIALNFIRTYCEQKNNKKIQPILTDMLQTTKLSERTIIPNNLSDNELDELSATSKQKAPDYITKLRNNVSDMLSDITVKEIKQHTAKTQTNTTECTEKDIKDFCDKTFDRSISKKIADAIISMPTQTMIKQTIKYTIRKNIDEIYEKITPIIKNRPV